MSKIETIDKNFNVEIAIKKDSMNFFNIDTSPFSIYGVYKENGVYRRMPERVAKAVSEGVYHLHSQTAGGRVRFKTDSRHIAIIAKMHNISKAAHFALSGTTGLDIYEKIGGKYNYIKSFIPPYDIKDGFESVIDLKTATLRDITINFPNYSGVSELFIGIDENAALFEGDAYKNEKPVVFYGSSITQGGCASRPGNSYEAILSRELDIDYVNLGFSGNAKAEDEIIEYISTLDMSVFVYDYDHNAPTTEHLGATHEKMFKAIRKAHPHLPIIIMSRPQYNLNETGKERLEIIKNTYKNAIQNGDKNVYLLDGPVLMAMAKNNGTVDDCHPNDLGFMSMAQAVKKVLSKLIKEN